jgi:NADH:ubiquinone oxidoreductase subunit E
VKATTASPCQCTEDSAKFSEIENLIDLYKDKEGNLIQILHAAEELCGYLPQDLLQFIADALHKPLSEITGVATFYSFFSMKPRGRHTIRVCLGTACYVRGGKKIIEALQNTLDVGVGETTGDGKFTFEVARCIGACGLAPAMMIDGKVYRQVTPQKLGGILAKYNDEGGAK